MSYLLYRTVKTNFVPYITDNMGRDTYISCDNGGFSHMARTSTNFRHHRLCTSLSRPMPRQYKVKAPNFRYHSDGSGRDKYICINSGGLFYDEKPMSAYKLSDFLRNGERSWYGFTPKKLIKYSKNEIAQMNRIKSIERGLIKRLYTSPVKEMKNKKMKITFGGEKNNNGPSNLFKSCNIGNYNSENTKTDYSNKKLFNSINYGNKDYLETMPNMIRGGQKKRMIKLEDKTPEDISYHKSGLFSPQNSGRKQVFKGFRDGYERPKKYISGLKQIGDYEYLNHLRNNNKFGTIAFEKNIM